MGLGSHASRIALAGTVLLGSLSAMPAVAQVTLTVTLGGPADTSSTASPLPLTDISAISFGSSGDYVARIDAAGAAGSSATNVTVTVAPPAVVATGHGIPTASTPPGIVTVTGGTNCTTSDSTGTMTCTIAKISAGDVVDVPFKVNLPVPTKLDANGKEAIPSDLADCPDEAANAFLGQLTVGVAGTSATVTPAPPADTKVSKYADLVAALDGPASATQGQTVTYTATVTNDGPCPAINVFVDTTVGSGLLLQSGAGACTTDAQCSLGDMAPGQSTSFTKTYHVDTLRNNLTSTNNPNNITVHSGDSSDPTNVIAGTDDPDTSNNSPATTTFVQTGAGGGCSSAGSAVPWATAVLGLLALSIRRRRAP